MLLASYATFVSCGQHVVPLLRISTSENHTARCRDAPAASMQPVPDWLAAEDGIHSHWKGEAAGACRPTSGPSQLGRAARPLGLYNQVGAQLFV
jgi:hypothetical protein